MSDTGSERFEIASRRAFAGSSRPSAWGLDAAPLAGHGVAAGDGEVVAFHDLNVVRVTSSRLVNLVTPDELERALSRPTHPCRLDVFRKTEAAGQRRVGEEGDLVDLAAAQGEHHHAPGLREQVAAEGRLAVGAGRAYL